MPGTMDILSLLRLKHAPFLSLLLSVFALVAVIALYTGKTITGVIATVLIGLGLPEEAVEAGTGAVHTWMVTEPRLSWLSWGAVVLAGAMILRYWAMLIEFRGSVKELVAANEAVKRARAPLGSEDGHVIRESEADWQHRRAILREQQDLHIRSHSQVISEVNQTGTRLLGVIWLSLAVAVELSNWTSLGLAAVGGVWLAGLFVVARPDLRYQSMQYRWTWFKGYWLTLVTAGKFALIALILLPAFFLLTLWTPSLPAESS